MCVYFSTFKSCTFDFWLQTEIELNWKVFFVLFYSSFFFWMRLVYVIFVTCVIIDFLFYIRCLHDVDFSIFSMYHRINFTIEWRKIVKMNSCTWINKILFTDAKCFVFFFLFYQSISFKVFTSVAIILLSMWMVISLR